MANGDFFSAFPGGGFGAGVLGLGAVSDIFGAYSQMQAANRQRQQLAQAQALAGLLQDPARLAANANQLYQGYSPQAQTQINRYLNANLAGRGLQEGGAGNEFVTNAWAQLEAQQRNAALQAYLQALGGAGGTIAGMQTGGAAGGGGGTQAALHNLALLQALRRSGPQDLSPGQSTFGRQVLGPPSPYDTSKTAFFESFPNQSALSYLPEAG